MGLSQQATIVFTVVAAGTIKGKRGVNWLGQQAVADSAIMGIADCDAVAGDALRVVQGVTAVAESGAAIDGTETRLKTDAQGRLVPWTTGVTVAARLMPGQTATAAGQFVEVFPIIS